MKIETEPRFNWKSQFPIRINELQIVGGKYGKIILSGGEMCYFSQLMKRLPSFKAKLKLGCWE